jgi:hypothetical protein
MTPATQTPKLAERVAHVPAGSLAKLEQLRRQYPRWRNADQNGYLGTTLGHPDRNRYFAALGSDRALERLHAVLA